MSHKSELQCKGTTADIAENSCEAQQGVFALCCTSNYQDEAWCHGATTSYTDAEAYCGAIKWQQ